MSDLLRWLLDGTDSLTLSDEWKRERLSEYEAYTKRQLDQGRVVTDSAEMRRRAFWTRQEAKSHQRPALVFPKAGQR